MAAPGPSAGRLVLHRNGNGPFSRPLSPRHRWTFDGRCRRLVRRYPFLGPRIRAYHALLVRRRSVFAGGGWCAAGPGLAAGAAIALGSALRALCSALHRGGRYPAGRRTALCRPNQITLERPFLLRSIAGTRE